jgi:hypothetical protein
MRAWADVNCADEAKDGETPIQFFYKTRKKAWGPFKQQTWELPAEIRAELGGELQKKFEFLIAQLKANGTKDITLKHVVQKVIEVEPPALG